MPSHSTLTISANSLTETQQLAGRLASVLQLGDVVALIGELGAGKTHFVQAIASSLAVDQDFVNSPTFVLIQEYEGTLPICHIDAYRLHDSDEFLELGADEILGGETVCLIEWADRVADVLPRDRITIQIEATGEQSRQFRISSSGPRSDQALRDLSASQLPR